MKTIIIPTDLSLGSLDLVKNAVLNFPGEKINIVLTYGMKLAMSEFQPMEFLGNRNYKSEICHKFTRLKKRLFIEHKNQINKIDIEVFTGTNAIAFSNFLKRNNISIALIPNTALRNFPTKKHYDITKLIKSNMSNIIEVDHDGRSEFHNNSGLTVTSISQKINLA